MACRNHLFLSIYLSIYLNNLFLWCECLIIAFCLLLIIAYSQWKFLVCMIACICEFRRGDTVSTFDAVSRDVPRHMNSRVMQSAGLRWAGDDGFSLSLYCGLCLTSAALYRDLLVIYPKLIVELLPSLRNNLLEAHRTHCTRIDCFFFSGDRPTHTAGWEVT